MPLLLLVLWGVRTLRALFQQASLWQIKEYRVDRLRAHLATPGAMQGLLHPVSTAKWGFFLLLLSSPSLSASTIIQSALTIAYAAEAALAVSELTHKNFRRPRPTLKVFGISLLTVALLGGFLLGLGDRFEPTVVLLGLDRTLPLLITLAILALAPATKVQRSAAVTRAKRRIQAHPQLTTIGITGSFGKSSTKEFLEHLLRDRFQVLKTPANVNTEIGIARVVLEGLQDDHDVFICEMGAYREGEIARAASMVRPTIGILTAVSDQHLALFGSRDAIARAKGELLRSLPANGTAIVNGDDPTCVRLSREPLRVRRVLRFGTGMGADVRATRVSVLPRSLRLTVEIGGATAELAVPLLGEQQVPNILAATAAASVMGMTLLEIAKAAGTLTPPPRTMELRQGIADTTVVDDSYSANPNGVLAAIAFLRHANAARMIIILTSMIELGRDAPGAHRKVGEVLSLARPEITILTSPDYAGDVIQGAADVHPETARRIVMETDVNRVLARVRPLLGKDTMVMLEGRIPERLRQALLAS